MIRFENDYLEGCIPEILEKIVNTNYEQIPGYRLDDYCEIASHKIKESCNADYLDVHYLVGGTQANMTVLDAILRPHQGVVSTILGHINVHEVGAIEGRGHKVLALYNTDYMNEDNIELAQQLDEESKLSPQTLKNYLEDYFKKDDWHTVQPGAVYISHPTERGALYTKDELIQLKEICDEYEMPLYLDGARLAYALAAEENDIELEDLAKYCDIFYIGGTKCGALFGEAVCFSNKKYNKDFRNITKHNGAIIAKGRLLGIQFDVLFTNNTYIDKCRDAYIFAMRIKRAFEDKNIDFIANSFTNQQFPILSKKQQSYIKSSGINFNYEAKIDDNYDAVRFCTDWATKKEAIEYLEKVISKL
ncbi:threonine aldolase family protein [Peptostreptococcus sp. D1]|uniref:threonine aldolase family protein n=1 Tax=Peptostreptococcus sp. D1 TaxID=72304 RepID=UPI0008DECFCC|nr:beta-eliminating lyase-related protein [Peptostreptococcus sp. D1]SFE44751.1 L-threonine aldolase [Peptostreptococcus sp. D1]